MLLIRRALIGLARRHGDALDAQRRHAIEKRGDPGRVGIIEQRAIDGNAKSALLGELQGLESSVVDTGLTDRMVVHSGVAIEVNRPIEVTVWRVTVEVFRKQKRVGADGHEFVPRDRALHNLRKFLVQQGLAPGDHDDRRAAFVDRREAIGERQALVENLVRIINLAAARAGKIAAEQRFEHQDERKALASRQALAHDIDADLRHLQNRYSQSVLLKICCYSRSRRTRQSLSSAGSLSSTFSATPGKVATRPRSDEASVTSSTSISLVAHTAPLGYELSAKRQSERGGFVLTGAGNIALWHAEHFSRFWVPRTTPTFCVNGALADFSSDWR